MPIASDNRTTRVQPFDCISIRIACLRSCSICGPVILTAVELTDLGWDDEWTRVFAPYAADGLIPARVAIEFNYIYRLFAERGELQAQHAGRLRHEADRKSTRLNSSHSQISYAVFCLKKKKNTIRVDR